MYLAIWTVSGVVETILAFPKANFDEVLAYVNTAIESYGIDTAPATKEELIDGTTKGNIRYMLDDVHNLYVDEV